MLSVWLLAGPSTALALPIGVLALRRLFLGAPRSPGSILFGALLIVGGVVASARAIRAIDPIMVAWP